MLEQDFALKLLNEDTWEKAQQRLEALWQENLGTHPESTERPDIAYACGIVDGARLYHEMLERQVNDD